MVPGAVGSGMYHVLVPVDRNEDRAREQTAYVTGLAEAGADVRATVVHAFEDYQPDVPREMRTLERVSSVKTAVRGLEAAGVEAETVEIGSPIAPEIVETARELDVDGIVVAGRDAGPVGKALFGSVAQTVVLDADRPVTVVGVGE